MIAWACACAFPWTNSSNPAAFGPSLVMKIPISTGSPVAGGALVSGAPPAVVVD